jgi:hypothetical protein
MKKSNITNETRRAVYRRDGYQCAVCGDPRRLQIHHVQHRAQGGGDEQMNLVTLCPVCHAIAHGTRFPALPEYFTREDVDQLITEYLSDLYADLGFRWPDGEPLFDPWAQGTDEEMMQAVQWGMNLFDHVKKMYGGEEEE